MNDDEPRRNAFTTAVVRRLVAEQDMARTSWRSGFTALLRASTATRAWV